MGNLAVIWDRARQLKKLEEPMGRYLDIKTEAFLEAAALVTRLATTYEGINAERSVGAKDAAKILRYKALELSRKMMPL